MTPNENYIDHLKYLAVVYRQMKDYHEKQAHECWNKWSELVEEYQDLEEDNELR